MTCWGFVNGPTAPTVAKVIPGRTVVALNGGTDDTCVLFDDDTVACSSTTTGTSYSSQFQTPRSLPGNHRARAVQAGHKGDCAILDDGTLACWGGTWGTPTTSIATPKGHALRIVAEGSSDSNPPMPSACFVLDDGTVDCPFTVGMTPTALDFGPGRSVTMLRRSAFYGNCALLDNATARCWGGLADVDGLGGSGQAAPTTAVNLGTGRTVTAVTTGAYSQHACAFLDNGALKCWGENSSGQLGIGDTVSRGSKPTDMGDKLPAVKL